MSRRLVILCALAGCVPAPRGPTPPAEPSTPASAVADVDHGEHEGRESNASPASAAAPAEDPPRGGDSGEPEPDDAASSDPAEPVAATAPADAPPAPTAGPPVIVEGEVPRYARLDFSPRKLGKQRAMLRHAGTLYAPSSLEPLTDAGKGDWLLLEVPVLDADAAGAPRRPRVLCENDASRLGVAVDAADLATTVRTNAFVGPRITPPERVTPKTPGLRLAGGTEVEVRGEAYEGMTPIGYRGLFLVAEGYVASDAIDVVYTPGELEDDRRTNGELMANVRFLDAPDGLEIARTERDPGVLNTLHVFRLSPVVDGHMLVRYHESKAFVVGWVPAKDVMPYRTKTWDVGRGGGIGFGSGKRKEIELARGTRLVPTTSNEVIGVVTKTHDAPCVAECDGPNPHVRVWACSRVVTLRAVR